MSQTIRINPSTRTKLEKIAAAESTTMTKMLDKVVDAYRRQRFLEETNAAFAALRENRGAWEQELKERREWDVALSDGIEKEDG